MFELASLFKRAFSWAKPAAESVKVSLIPSEALPRHVAIIMDGNGRWARSRNLPRIEGHRMGARTVRMVVEEARRLGIRYVTLYCFSSENWGRPREEVEALMKLFVQHLGNEAQNLIKNGVRLRAVGNLERLPAGVRDSLESVVGRSQNETGLDLILAISYGGRDEIISAVQQIGEKCISGQLVPSEIGPETIHEHLYAPDVPDPDLLIRTSNEFRISNFLLWQLAYSEVVISPQFWPAFSKEEFLRCLKEYAGRKRRFGLTGEQVSAGAKKAL